MNQLSKPFQILLHSIWLLLFAMAIIMYKERLYADASYYFFHTVNTGGFHVEHGRIVLALSQVVPLIGYYLYLPLKALMVLGSVGHEVFYYSVFLVLFYKLKDQAGGIAVLLIHVIGQLWLYYSPMLEICYGAALSVLFYSILRSGKYKDDKWLLFLLIIQWFVMTSHLENFILVAFPIAYDIINRGYKKRIHSITLSLMIIGLVIEFLTLSGYEFGKVDVLSSNTQIGFHNLIKLDYLNSLRQLFIGYYLDLVLLFGITIIIFLKRLEFKKMILTVGSAVVVVMAVNKAALAIEFTRYFESMYNPLVALVVIGFMYEVFNTQKKTIRNILLLCLCVIALVRVNWIWKSGENIRLRSAQMERNVDYLQTLGHSKYLTNEANYKRKYSLINWSNPIETLLYSAIDGKDNCITVINYEDYNYNKNYKKLNDSNYIYRRFEIEDYTFLNSRLFQLKKEKYSTINNGGFDKTFQELAKQIKIELINPIEAEIGDTSHIQIRILNNNSEKIPSNLLEKIYISYHWYKDNELYQWDGLRTPIEVDIYGNYVQDIDVGFPNELGSFEFVPDIVVEEKDWFMLSNRYPVKLN
jgi:hypothetical protein